MPQFLPHDAATTGDPNFSNDETFSVDLSTPAVDGDSIAFESASNTWKPSSGGGGGSPIGTIIQSILTQVQINTQEAGTWQLCDGAATPAGSALLALGFANVPDAQGRVLAGAGVAGSAASKTLNTQLGTQNVSHTHTTGALTGTVQARAPFGGGAEVTAGTGNTNANTGSSGGDEARPFTYVVNHFIKIN